MKIKIKKILILILLATLILNLFNFSHKVEAKTNGYTADTAINWVASRVGSPVGSGECVDLINAYEQELSGTYGSRKWMAICILY